MAAEGKANCVVSLTSDGIATRKPRAYEELSMIIALYIAAGLILAAGSLYFAWRNRDFLKFLAGAFFVSWGILFYLYLADVSVPLLGTGIVEPPRISGIRSIVHFILFLLQEATSLKRTPQPRIRRVTRYRSPVA
jgi:uncharacterized protein (DUF486 family)